MIGEATDDLRSFFIHPVLAVWWSRKFIQPPSTTRINNKKMYEMTSQKWILERMFILNFWFFIIFRMNGDNGGIYVIKPTINWLKSNIYTQRRYAVICYEFKAAFINFLLFQTLRLCGLPAHKRLLVSFSLSFPNKLTWISI